MTHQFKDSPSLGRYTPAAKPVQSEELNAAYQRIDELETALKFYADPIAFQRKLGRTNIEDGWLQIPDFYSECNFGAVADEVLS